MDKLVSRFINKLCSRLTVRFKPYMPLYDTLEVIDPLIQFVSKQSMWDGVKLVRVYQV